MLAWRNQRAFRGGCSVSEFADGGIKTTWDDPETRNEQAHLETLKAKVELGVTKHQIWRELGYTQGQIDAMDEDGTAERVADTNIGAEILRNFQAGTI